MSWKVRGKAAARARAARRVRDARAPRSGGDRHTRRAYVGGATAAGAADATARPSAPPLADSSPRPKPGSGTKGHGTCAAASFFCLLSCLADGSRWPTIVADGFYSSIKAHDRLIRPLVQNMMKNPLARGAARHVLRMGNANHNPAGHDARARAGTRGRRRWRRSARGRCDNKKRPGGRFNALVVEVGVVVVVGPGRAGTRPTLATRHARVKRAHVLAAAGAWDLGCRPRACLRSRIRSHAAVR